jgi:predicted ArsR family transcriptional regulator
MAGRPVRPSSLSGTRGRIVDIIRRSPATATEIAARLDLTYNAVRSHLSALERDGLVRLADARRGDTRPAVVYELAPEVDDVLSRAYMPFASHLVRVLGERVAEPELDDVMREVGRRLARDRSRPAGSLTERIDAASALLQELGAPNDVERASGTARIRGLGCVLASAVQGRPQVCHAMESLLEEFIGAPVRQCCDRTGRPRCCFEIVEAAH